MSTPPPLDTPDPPPPVPTLLLTVTGTDRPGVTSRLFEVLSTHGADVDDVEQVVVHGRLLLGLAVVPGPDLAALQSALVATAAELGVDVTAEHVTPAVPAVPAAPSAPRLRRHHVTVLGRPLPPAAVAAVTAAVAGCGANIDRIERLSRYPVHCLELLVSGGDHDELRAAVTTAAAGHGVDVAVQRASLYRRAKRLVVLDVDSTLVQGEVIELLADRAGCLAQVAEITERAMRGELDFEASLRERVALLEGLDESALDAVAAELRLARGARTLVRTLKRLGYGVGVVSGGFTQVIAGLAADLELDHVRANTLEVVDGRLTGRVIGPVIDRAAKATALSEFAAAAGVPLEQTVAVGDGANDLDMLSRAGLGIAYNAKPVVREAADASVTVPYLDAVLFLLGLRREDIEAADDEAE